MSRRSAQKKLKERQLKKFKDGLKAGAVFLVSGGVILYSVLSLKSNSLVKSPDSAALSAVVEAAPGGEVVDSETSSNVPKHGTIICAEFREECIASAELKDQNCDEKYLKRKLSGAVAQPLQSDDCKLAVKRLEESCSKDCGLDHNSLMLVPGKMEFSINLNPDESGKCLGKVDRQIIIRGACVR